MSLSPLGAYQVHEVAIVVTASSLDSSSSISTHSPTLIIPESLLPHDARSSLGSSHGTPTVKFAPLPQVDPNRKRSLAPLGVPGRTRRKLDIQQEGGSLLWSAGPDEQEESVEDPIILFAKFVKKTGKTLWRKVRKGSKVVPQEDIPCFGEPVLDIKSTSRVADVAVGEKGDRVSKAVGLEDKRGRPASWSPLAERRTLNRCKAQRKSTSDLPQLSVTMVP